MTVITKRSLLKLLNRFRFAKQGNVSIIFGFSLIPMIGLIGIGVDYGVALADKSKLDNAADAASLAAVATAKAYVAANQTDSNLTSDAIAAGLTQASSTFVVNAGSLPFATPPSVSTYATAAPVPATCSSTSACIYLTRSGQTFSSAVVYTTAATNHFGQMFGAPTINIAGIAASTANIPSYLDFYLLIDVSGSMGLPATSSGQSALMQNNGGCQFACHFPGQTAGYNYALANNIQLRSGAVNSAVCGLLAQAAQPLVPNQYRVGLYPFITQMGTLAAISNNITNVNVSAGCTSNPQITFTTLLDTGSTQLNNTNDPTTGLGSGGTHFENAFQQLPSAVLHYGDGSSSALSRPFVFLVTDGMQNSQYFWSQKGNTMGYPGSPSSYNGWNSSNWTGSSPNYMDSTKCATLKASGATISVLYIPYTVLTVGSSNQSETIAADNAIPQIPTALQQCASSSAYFYTANTPADISAALAAMFNQAIQVTHLIQ